MPRSAHAYQHLIGFAVEHPWAITPNMRATVARILARRLAGADDDDDDGIAFAAKANDVREIPIRGGGLAAVIPIAGVIAPRLNLLSKFSGGTTFEGLTAQLHAAVDNPDVSTIVFDVDSPGGNVAGASEFAREVLRARTRKPIIAHANFLMASAAYWPMACATEIVAAPSALTGSIGVFTIHDDISEALGKLGIKRELITAGKYKGEGVCGPLTDEARAHIGALVDGNYNRMVGDIARGRGVTAQDIRSGYGEGRILSAEDALAARLVDRIATLDETLARVTQPAAAGARPRAVAVSPPADTDVTPAPAAATSQIPPAGQPDRHRQQIDQRVIALRLQRLKAS